MVSFISFLEKSHLCKTFQFRGTRVLNTFFRFNCKEVKLFYGGRGLTLVMIIWGQGINLSYPAFGFFVLFCFWRQALTIVPFAASAS